MKKLRAIVGTVVLLIVTYMLSPWVMASDSPETYSTTPLTNNGKKWRIGYYEGGDYSEYHTTLTATIKGLMDLGWLHEKELPPTAGATGQSLWEACSRDLDSDYLEFVVDAFYSSEWNKDIREQNKQALKDRLETRNDLDLIIAMGTWAGLDLKAVNPEVPVIVLAVSDAVASGIIKDPTDSGSDWLHARVDPQRFERQIRIFHTIINFSTLGMIFRNDVEGRSYAAIEEVSKVARERGFTIKTCYLADEAGQKEDQERFIQCFANLCGQVDAIYVTAQKAVNKETVPVIAGLARDAGIPTFSQAGRGEVKSGLLMSISQAGFKYVGRFYAETMANVFNGAKPGDLEQVFKDPSKIAINLSTAEAIQFYPSLDVLSVADEIFR